MKELHLKIINNTDETQEISLFDRKKYSPEESYPNECCVLLYDAEKPLIETVDDLIKEKTVCEGQKFIFDDNYKEQKNKLLTLIAKYKDGRIVQDVVSPIQYTDCYSENSNEIECDYVFMFEKELELKYTVLPKTGVDIIFKLKQ